MYFKQDVPRIIKKIYESDTQDPLTDCQKALEKRFNNDNQKVIFIQEYLDELSPATIAEHFNYIAGKGCLDFYTLALYDYNVFNIVALVKRKK